MNVIDPAPRMPPSRNERRILLVMSALFLGLFAVDFFQALNPRKLSILFVVAAWGPLLVVHEFGHAFAARWAGWKVSEIVIGYGREWLRLQWGDTLIRIKVVPVEGYIVPSPSDLSHARLKSAWIYAAGPGAEALVVLGVWLMSGGQLFTPSDELGMIVLQSIAVAACIGIVFNLIPIPSDHGNATDGLGILMSLVTPESHFRVRLLGPVLQKTTRLLMLERSEPALEFLSAAIERHGESARLLAFRAVAEALQGDFTAAETSLKLAEKTAEKEDLCDLETCRAWELLIRDESSLVLFALQAARQAVAYAPGCVLARCLLGRAFLEQGAGREAYIELMSAYKLARSPEEEGLCLGYLTLAARQAGPRERSPLIPADAAERFARAFLKGPAGPELRRRVEREGGRIIQE